MNVLEGLRVLDLSQNIAGPHCTQVLADLGADVIKVEPPGGDPTRLWGPPFWEGEAPLFLAFNRNKRSICLDLKTEGGREVVGRLAGRADVFVQAFRSGVAESLGLGPAQLRASRPDVIYVSITGYGAEGPLREQPGYDPLIQAYAGIMSITGHPDGAPARVGGSVVDVGTGILTAMGILAALRERDRTGAGSHVESSLLATAVGWIPYHVQSYLASGVVPRRMGTALAMVAPYEAFATRDGELMIAAGNDGIFRRMCDALGVAQLADDPRFRRNPERVAHREELHALLEERTRTLATRELRELLDGRRVPSAPIQDIGELTRDAQVLADGLLERVEHPRIPEYRNVAFPVRFDGARPPMRSAPPTLGEHSEQVLAELGYGADEIERLKGSGAVGPAEGDG